MKIKSFQINVKFAYPFACLLMILFLILIMLDV